MLIYRNKYLHMGLKHSETIHPQILSQSSLPFRDWLHSLLYLSPSINLPICLLVLLRLQVIVAKYMKTNERLTMPNIVAQIISS